jgi:hypothetical protein
MILYCLLLVNTGKISFRFNVLSAANIHRILPRPRIPSIYLVSAS